MSGMNKSGQGVDFDNVVDDVVDDVDHVVDDVVDHVDDGPYQHHLSADQLPGRQWHLLA